MDLPATQAIDDEDLIPTQHLATDDGGREPSLVGKLLINSTDEPHSIFSGTTIIGRQPGCTIVLNDETVSKRHAEIEAESSDKAVFIKDLRSSNKTKINDTKLRPEASYQIKDNDKLTFGKVTATFKTNRAIDDSLVAGTPQVNRNRAVIPDTPDTSMNNSSTTEGDVSTIPGTQADENDSCFRRPQIPVRTSISNEHESPKHVPFMLDDVPSPLANTKDKESDISEVETQRFTVNNTKEMTDNSIYTVETQKVVIHEKSSANSHDNEDKRKLNSSVKKVLSDEFENQPALEDMETQKFACAKSDSRKSENTSIYSAETQQVLPDAIENQSMENMETQAYVSAAVDKTNPADVSIHSAATQKIASTVPENDLIENLDTQHFSRNSLSSVKRKSANTSIYNAETQKLVADVSNEALDNIETQRFVSTSEYSKEKSADVSIYSATTQKIESTSENGAIENLETQKFDKRGSHQEKMVSSLSFSIQDIDTMPFTKHELPLGDKSSHAEVQNADDILLNSAPLGEKSSNAEMQNDNDILLDSAPNASKSDSDNKVHDSENENDNEKSDSRIEQSMPTPSKKLDKSQTGDEIMQNEKQINETPSKSSKDLLQTSSKLNKSKSLVESDDEEEIFSQNLIENSPFALLLDDSKNDSKEQSNLDLQKYVEHENEKTIDSECNASSNKADTSTDNKNLTKNKSTIVSNDDSETDEEGAFSNHLSEENENQKSHQKTGNDSETDEEGVFSSHASEEKGEKSNSKADESDSETDEEGVFSGRLSKSSKGLKNSSSKIIEESESEDEGVPPNLSKTETTKDPISPDENNTKTVDNIPSAHKSTKKCSLNKLDEIVQRESPVPESDDDIFNENYEEKRTSSSNLDRTNDPIVDKDNLDSIPKSPITDTVNSTSGENDNNDVDDMAPTQIVETDMSLAPTQIVNTRRISTSEEEDGPKEIDELAPTQLIETQTLPLGTENTLLTPKQSRVTDSVKAVAKEYDDMDLAPTQKLDDTQECAESLAPTQKVADTQLCSEEMGALQFTESLGPTQVIENESNAIENEIAASPKISPNISKRQLEEVEITNNKKQKTAEVSQRVQVELNSTVEQNLNEMFEGPEEKMADSEPPMETQRLENILESSQTEEDSATGLDVSISQPSPTLSNKRGNIRGKNRRRLLMLNKSASSNATDRSVVNLNDTIEKNLNDLFHNTVDSVEIPEPEPMLTQQLENVLNSSQDSNPTENKEEEGRTLTVSRRKSRLSLSMNLNNSMQKTQQEKEKLSSNVQLAKVIETTSQSDLNEKLNNSIQKTQQEKEKRSSNVQLAKVIETTSQSSLNEKSPQKEDYAANLEENKDNAISETPSKYDKDIVYRRGTIGFTDDLKPVSTFDRVAFTDKYSTSDSQSDGDDILKLKSPNTPSGKRRVSLRLKNVDLNSSLPSSASDRDIEKKQVKSPVLSQSKKTNTVHNRTARKRNPVVQLDKLASPLYRKYAKPVKRVMACGTIGFTTDLQPVESEELVSAASTESEDDLRSQVGMSSPKMVDVNKEKLSPDSPVEDEKQPPGSSVEDEKQSPDSPVENEKQSPDSPVEDEKQSPDSPLEVEKQPPGSPVEDEKQSPDSPVEDEKQSPDSPMEDDKSDSDDAFLKSLPIAKIAGTTECPATASQLDAPSDRETDTESLKSVKYEIPNRVKWYAEKRFDGIYEKCEVNKKSRVDSESENDEDKEIQANNVSANSAKDDWEERSAAIDKLLAGLGADKEVKKRKPKAEARNDSGKENAQGNVVATRSRKIRKANTPPPKPVEDAGEDSDKTNDVSSSSDDENSQELGILPKYRPTSPLKIDMEMLTGKVDDEEDSELEFQAPPRPKPIVNRAKARTSPLKTRRRRRKSACNNDINDVTPCENNTDDNDKKAATPNVGTVDKSGLVFQVSRDSKTTTTSRMSGATNNRTKRIIDSDDDDSESTREPSAKRTKTLVGRQKLQEATVVISPLKDKIRKLREANRLNVANVTSTLKQPDATLEEKKTTRAPKALPGRVAKTARTDSSDMSAVESSIVEDKNESRNKPKTRSRPAARDKKAKVDTSSERNANSSKENLEESDVQIPKTRGRGRRNQATDSSVSDNASSQDEVPASDVENKSTRSTRGRLVRPNQAKKEEAKAAKKQSQAIEGSDTGEPEKPKTVTRKNTRKVTKQESKTIEDSDSEAAEETKPAVKKSTRGRLAKANDKSASGKKDVADSKNDKSQDKDSESQSSSQSVAARSTRMRKNKVNQESDSGSSETLEATTTTTTTRGSRKRPANDKPDLIIKVTEVDSKTETMTKSDETKYEQSKDEVNVFKLMKKKMHLKPEEPTKAPARKTRTRATKNATIVPESSSEESQEVAEIMKNSVVEDSKTTTTTRRRGRAIKSNLSYAENTESSDDVFEKPTARPKRARLAKADKSQSSQVSDTDEDSKSTQSSQKSTRRKHSPSPTPSSDAVLTPSRTSRLSLSPSKRPKVLFTGEKSDAHRNILTKLGGVETEEFNSCSVLITDKVRRTFKFLCSLARGIPIASVKWLDESKKANRFLDLEEYILNDPEAEAKFKFNLKESLDKARKHKLLEGYSVLLAPKIKQPPIAELKEMVLSSGGKPLVRAPAKWPEKCVVVTTEQELDSAKKLIAKAPKSVKVHSIEFILTGILRQEVNFNEFKLLG